VNKLRAAILGTGGIANAHAEAILAERDRVVLVAACDLDTDRVNAFADKYHVPQRFTDLDQMLASVSPDLVHLCTPPTQHSDQAIACMRHGAHVWCEKPLVGSLAEFDRVSAVEAETGKWTAVVLQWRFGAMGKHIYQLINSGELGRPLVGVCNTLWYRAPSYYAVNWRGRWDNERGGVTLGHGIHLMDLFLWLYGEWSDVRAAASVLDHQIEIDDVSMAIVRFENGAMGSIVNSVVSPRQETYLRLDFQRAAVEVTALYHYENANWRFSTFENSPFADSLTRWQSPSDTMRSGHYAAYRDLLDRLSAGERPVTTGAESRRILEFVTALYKSAFTGDIVQRGSIIPGDPFYTALNGDGRRFTGSA